MPTARKRTTGTARKAKKAAGKARGTAKKATKRAAKRTPSSVKKTARKARKARKTTKKTTKKARGTAKQSTKRAAKRTPTSVKKTTRKARKTAKKTTKKARTTTKKTAKKARGAAKKAKKGAAKRTPVSVKKTARKARKTAKKTVRKARKTAKRTTRQVQGTAKQATRRAERAGKDAVAAVTSAGQRPTRTDAVALIKRDHESLKRLFTRYEALGDGATKSKRDLAEEVVKDLSVHAAIEEQLLYPRIRSEVTGGGRMVDDALEEHADAERLLASIDGLSGDDPGLDPLMKELGTAVRQHIRSEEASNGPLAGLSRALDEDARARLGQELQLLQRGAPTRPHPRAPQTAPANIVVGAAAGIVDKARDLSRDIRRDRGS